MARRRAVEEPARPMPPPWAKDRLVVEHWCTPQEVADDVIRRPLNPNAEHLTGGLRCELIWRCQMYARHRRREAEDAWVLEQTGGRNDWRSRHEVAAGVFARSRPAFADGSTFVEDVEALLAAAVHMPP
jgi:hypothetical protein